MDKFLTLLLIFSGVVLVLGRPQMIQRNDDELDDLLLALEEKGWWPNLFGDEEEETTTPVPTTAAPETGIDFSVLSSQQICQVAKAFLPQKGGKATSRRDLVVNLIYHICLPSISSEDLDDIAAFLAVLLESEGETPPVPSTPASPDWWSILVDAINNGELDESSQTTTTEAAEAEETTSTVPPSPTTTTTAPTSKPTEKATTQAAVVDQELTPQKRLEDMDDKELLSLLLRAVKRDE